MRDLHLPLALCLCLGLVAACAPRPDPIVPEPTYDKFGRLEAVCVSDAERRDPTYVASIRELPRCEDRCDPGEQPTFTTRGQWPICVPRPDDNDDPDDPQRPTNPTRG